MNKAIARGLVILLCSVSLALHFWAESTLMIDSSPSRSERADNPDSHAEEDHFVQARPPRLGGTVSRVFSGTAADLGGDSLANIPQLPPPKPI
jgi:hypothetical protein